MKIFFCHSSGQKPLIREIRKLLPEHINAWVDEDKLLIGDTIAASLESAIKKDVDYILLFIDSQSVTSKWVEREIAWTLEHERRMDRIFLLPVIVDLEAWPRLMPEPLKERKFLKLEDYTENSVKSLAKRITSELFSLICRDIQTLRTPSNTTKASVIERTDEVLSRIADSIRKLVFGYRESKPLPVSQLRNLLEQSPTLEYQPEDFDTVMRKIIQNDLIPGLVFDGYELYVQEEHYKWKGRISLDAKCKIARLAASKVRSGTKIALDAGSTTDEVARVLCTRLEAKALFNLTIVTTSISAANIFLQTGTRLGFDDNNSGFRLFLAGGRVRPNTLAIVGRDREASALTELLNDLGGVDFSIVGVNGIDAKAGLTTHSNAETENKRVLIAAAKKPLVLGDTSKLGIVEQVCFATFADDILLITNDGGSDPRFQELIAIAASKVEIAS